MAEFIKAAMPWIIMGILVALACVFGNGEAQKNARAEKKHQKKQ